MAAFQTIPTLRLSEARSADTKHAFLRNLRGALLDVGFLYLDYTGELDEQLVAEVVRECKAFFDQLTDKDKTDVEMKNCNSFLGYSRLGNEITAGASDWREQYDLSTTHPQPRAGEPLYMNMRAPNQWPNASALPHFRPVFEEYMKKLSGISMFFTSLLAEAIGLSPTAFERFFDTDQQHKLKLVKYPDSGAGAGQGVGAHKDSMLSSYLLQASPHAGLQAQNRAGKWIDCAPVPNTLVVAVGQGLEAMTGGVCASTTHRVLSPEVGRGARFSIPFFQGVSFDAKFESMDVPESVRDLKKDSRERIDDVEFTFVKGRFDRLGEATLMNRIKSHQDVGERWYPNLLAQIREQQAREAATASSSPTAAGARATLEAR